MRDQQNRSYNIESYSFTYKMFFGDMYKTSDHMFSLECQEEQNIEYMNKYQRADQT